MRARTFLILFLALLPSLSLAQRGGGMGGRRGGGRTGGDRGMSREAPKFPEAKDLQKFNPASLLIDKRKKLSLADSQLAALRSLEVWINERNAPLLVRYDSVRRDYRPPSATNRDAAPGADSTRGAAMAEMRFMRSLLDSLVERRRADVSETLALIPDEKQKVKAAGVIDEQDKQFADALPRVFSPVGGGRP